MSAGSMGAARTALALLAAVLFGLGGLLVTPSAAAAAGSSAAAGQHVMIQNYAYSPASLNVRAGETVTWTNHDEAKHDVVGSGFRSPLLAKGQSWSYTFPTAGSYSYYCSLHPDMRAKVAVAPAPAPSTTAAAQPGPQAGTQPQAPPPQAAPRSTPAPSAASAAQPPSASTAPPSAPAAAPQPVQAAPAVAPAVGQSIDPMLLVAGLVSGVAVLCLLLLGARRAD